MLVVLILGLQNLLKKIMFLPARLIFFAPFWRRRINFLEQVGVPTVFLKNFNKTFRLQIKTVYAEFKNHKMYLYSNQLPSPMFHYLMKKTPFKLLVREEGENFNPTNAPK